MPNRVWVGVLFQGSPQTLWITRSTSLVSLFKQSGREQRLQCGTPRSLSLIALHALGCFCSRMAHQGTRPACRKQARAQVFPFSLQGLRLRFAHSHSLTSQGPGLSYMASSTAKEAGQCSLNVRDYGTAKIWGFCYRRSSSGRVCFLCQHTLWLGATPGTVHTACLPSRSWAAWCLCCTGVLGVLVGLLACGLVHIVRMGVTGQ